MVDGRSRRVVVGEDDGMYVYAHTHAWASFNGCGQMGQAAAAIVARLVGLTGKVHFGRPLK